MKVIIDISDVLLPQTRELATREGVTLTALVERGLTHVVSESEEPVRIQAAAGHLQGQRIAGGIPRRVMGNNQPGRL